VPLSREAYKRPVKREVTGERTHGQGALIHGRSVIMWPGQRERETEIEMQGHMKAE